MHILMISDVAFPRINGVSTSIQTFRRAFERGGHTCTLVVPEYPQAMPPEPHTLRVPSRRVPLDPEDRLMRLRPVLALAPELARRRPDVIHVQTPFIAHQAGLRMARALGVPRVETYHTLFEEYLRFYTPFLPAALLRSLARALSRRQCNRMDAVVVPSLAMKARLREYGVGRPLHVIPTGIPLHEFSGGDGGRFRSRHGIAADQPMLAYIGRVAHEKNIGFLLRVLARVRSAEPATVLVVAGEGPALDALRAQARSLRIADAVRFVGYLARDGELLDCYRAADAFVFSSRTETQGLVLLEAMALGVPVVSTAVMGTRDILADGRGALVAREDEAAFAHQREDLLRARLGQEARQHARKWSDEACARRMIELYQSLVGAARSGNG